jgi:hypothetical protein
MLTNILWKFIKKCNQYESKNKEEADRCIKDLELIQPNWSYTRKLEENPRIIDMRVSDKPLIEMLDRR